MCVCVCAHECVCVYVYIRCYCYVFWLLYLSIFSDLRSVQLLMFYRKMYGMFYANDEPEGKFLYTETIKLYGVRQKACSVKLQSLFQNHIQLECSRSAQKQRVAPYSWYCGCLGLILR